MNTISTTVICAVIAVSACAPLPSQIKPTPAQNDYSGLSCKAAIARLAQEETKLAKLTAEQEKSARNDAIGVAVVLVPVSSVSGKNRKKDIAVSKGEVIALKSRIARCN
ncbi:hypothetical protein [uncultured Mameliella sp.]|uniref:hypothetical protein n=1 Tax=uncultured Mameliella sp. TaxID=1447087 RepID=UPI002625C72F|nr:hypothetical protein [uncultured Mameliella sp.]